MASTDNDGPLTLPLRKLDPPSTSTEEPILLHAAGNKCYVYEIEDVKRLRVQHHICGVLMGTLPQVAQQNIFLGLPLQLLPEEVAVLLDYKLAVIIDSARSYNTPTVPESQEYYLERRLKNAVAQQELTKTLEKEKKAKMQEVYKEQIEKRRKEKQQERQRKRGEGLLDEEAPAVDASLDHIDKPPDQAKIDEPLIDQQKAKELGSDPSIPFLITIPGASDQSNQPWYRPTSPETPSHTSLRSAFKAGLFTALDPIGNPLHKARIEVFKDLWLKGYFLGGGIKFGADFLVYPGDPLRYHSHFSATVLPTPLSDFSPIEVVAWGRLATAVKKNHLLASFDESSATTSGFDGDAQVGNSTGQRVRYLTLEWAGFG